AVEEDRGRAEYRRADRNPLERQERELALSSRDTCRVLAADLRREPTSVGERLGECEQSADQRSAVAQLEHRARDLDRVRGDPARRRKRAGRTRAVDELAIAVARGRDLAIVDEERRLARGDRLGERVGAKQR